MNQIRVTLKGLPAKKRLELFSPRTPGARHSPETLIVRYSVTETHEDGTATATVLQAPAAWAFPDGITIYPDGGEIPSIGWAWKTAHAEGGRWKPFLNVATTVVKTYTLAIEEGTPTAGTIAVAASDGGVSTALSLSWAWNVSPTTVETDLASLRNSDDTGDGVLLVTGGNLPFNVIKIQVTSNVTLNLGTVSLTRETNSLTPRASLPFCFEPAL